MNKIIMNTIVKPIRCSERDELKKESYKQIISQNHNLGEHNRPDFLISLSIPVIEGGKRHG